MPRLAPRPAPLPKGSLLAAVLLALGAAGAGAQEPARLDATVRMAELLHRLGAGRAPAEAKPGVIAEPGRAVGGPRTAAAPVPGLAALETGPGGPIVRALVRVEGGDASAIERLGGRIRARAGDVVTAAFPLAALPALGADPSVRRVEAAVALYPDVGWGSHMAAGRSPHAVGTLPTPAAATLPNDRGTAEIGAASLRRRVGSRFHGLAGHGVIVGVYDSGLDLSHADFLGADGGTRVLYAWDQAVGSGDAPGALGPHVFDYGDECDAARIDAGGCAMADDYGHGTHVAGTAAGDGSATGNDQPAFRFTGVAPEAELIVVKGGDTGYTTDRLVDGVAYIFERARELGRPAVVNLSLGTQQGPHDGTTLVERALDALTGPGRIIVASAGNQAVNGNESPPFARAPSHAEGAAGDEHALVVPDYVPRPGDLDDAAYLELWYAGADSLGVAVVAPGGESVTVAAGDTALVRTSDGAVFVSNAYGGPNPENGENVAAILVFDDAESPPPASGDWTIRVTPDAVHAGGEYHLWLVAHNLIAGTRLAHLSGGTTNRYLVTAPASADSVLGVAAYTTRFEWATADDSVSFPFREPLGDIASFSSPGPRRDDTLKPLIAAPGKLIISSRAADGSLWADGRSLVERDGVHAALLGTSMAAPFVTGAAALLLQIDPELSPAAVRDLLARSARHDAFTPHPYTGEPDGTPNAQWGWGKLDVAAAARRLRPRGLVRAGERVNLSENPVRGDRLLINYDARPERVAVYTFAGEPVRRWTDGEIGELLAAWDVRNGVGRPVANGAYLLVVDFADERVMRKLFVLRP